MNYITDFVDELMKNGGELNELNLSFMKFIEEII